METIPLGERRGHATRTHVCQSSQAVCLFDPSCGGINLLRGGFLFNLVPGSNGDFFLF